MTNESKSPAEVAARVEHHLRNMPHLSEVIFRALLTALHRRDIATIDSIQNEARARLGYLPPEEPPDPNQPGRHPWDGRERELIEQITQEYFCRHFSVADVDDVINQAVKRKEVQTLEQIATRPNVSFRELAENLRQFCETPDGELKLAPAEAIGTRVALIRHLVNDELAYISVAKHHLDIQELNHVARSMIGSSSGMGCIGGKAGGMILAQSVLTRAENGKAPFLPLGVPESYFLRSDVVEDFLRLNRLDEYQNQKYRPIDELTQEHSLVRGMFRNCDFPLKIVHSLRQILDRMGSHPLIVRSSSLLEDRLGTAFSGKYASVFLANQGPREHRLKALLGAIAEVYASIMAPDPIVYRIEHNLIDFVEEMAVLIQKVVGFRFGDYFLPAFAGVAFSRNEYRWSPRIRREDGMVRLVMGLGTRAVDRSGSDYPRMVALGAPTLRPESTADEIVQHAQRTLDVIDLKNNRLAVVSLQEILGSGREFPMLDQLVSVYQDDELYASPGSRIDADPAKLCVTFDKLLRTTPFAQRVQNALKTLENTYGMPVDMEFACDGERFYVLQCRPLSTTKESAPVSLPTSVPDEDVVFDARRYVRTGLIEGIKFIVYVDPTPYDGVSSREERIEVARVVGRINHALEKRSFILIGPGRWGSNDVNLGVQVRYADINRCRMLIEVAHRKDGFLPEVSFGTHFFQDLVEEGIHYLPLYPDEPGNRFNTDFLVRSANVLANVVPAYAEFGRIIHVVDVAQSAQGRKLHVAMDGDKDRAIGFLK